MRVLLGAPCVKAPARRGPDVRLPPTSLALLAGITPEDVDVSIVDDLRAPIDTDAEADLVGLTVSTKTAVRAYEIADAFRRRGVPVVLGGIHPTVCPDEAIAHADAIVLGEAEGLWTHVLDDCRRGTLRRFYRAPDLPTLNGGPHPRRQLFDRAAYSTVNVVQAMRGCPYACHFCSVSAIYGRGLRERPVDDVVAELETLEGPDLFFVDDNIVGKPAYARRLLERMIPLRKQWIGQASATVANDARMLGLLRDSGCFGLFVGFETSSAAGLGEIGKRHHAAHRYPETVAKLHDHGVIVMGSFILGLDTDDESCFERLLEFALKSHMDLADIHILTPYPGTALYERLRQEGRLLDERWWLTYDPSDVVYRPKLLTRDALREGWMWTRREFYRLPAVAKRWVAGLGRRTALGNASMWRVSLAFRHSAKMDSV
jgi:radical SAM superfamily enzyme YgiQ (UPF0313 family)